jgi:hypothetical protein
VFERFSDAARCTVVLALEQARLLRHGYIGTEHVLLGLLDEDNTAARILREMEVHPAEVRRRVVEVVGKGRRQPRGRHIPFLGMLAQADGVGATILGRRACDGARPGSCDQSVTNRRCDRPGTRTPRLSGPGRLRRSSGASVAEGGGFEPPRDVTPNTDSSRAP